MVDSNGVTKHVLVFGWAAYRRRRMDGKWTSPSWMRFTTGEELWKWIDSKTRLKKTMYVWAHNQSFDYSASSGLSTLRNLGWVMKDAIIDSPPFVVRYAKKSSKLVITDTLNLWRMSLAAMGHLTGLTKLSMPSEWLNSASDDEYCRRDVEIIMKAVCEWADFLHNEDMGKFCLTVASQAMQTFRHRYLKHTILIDADSTALGIARKAYHGGRVECFYIGKLAGPLYLLDINSLYPYCMLTYEFPVRLLATAVDLSIVELRDVVKRYLCCARVTVETSTPMVPQVEDGKLTFPVGRFDADITTPELVYLLEHEKVLRVQQIAIYERAAPFVEFVTDLYQRRVEARANGKPVESEHYKLILNSFSGKWGQNGIKWRTLDKTDDMNTLFWPVVDWPSLGVINYRQWNGLIQVKETFPESANSHPAIAAHITAYGRMVLWALIRKIPAKHYFYCDTDSLLVSKEGFEHVKESVADGVLGSLKIVGEFSQAEIYGCKDYCLDGVRTCKGIRNQAVEIEPNTYRQEQWVGFRRALRKGWLDGPRVLQITKTLRRSYDKGVVGNDGFTIPFHR